MSPTAERVTGGARAVAAIQGALGVVHGYGRDGCLLRCGGAVTVAVVVPEREAAGSHLAVSRHDLVRAGATVRSNGR